MGYDKNKDGVMKKTIDGLGEVLNWWEGMKMCFTKKDKEWKELCQGEVDLKHAMAVFRRLLEVLYPLQTLQITKASGRTDMENIMEDKRPIKRITIHSNEPEGEASYIVDPRWYDEIKPYHENGEMASVVWFAIYKDNAMVSRVNSRYVDAISY